MGIERTGGLRAARTVLVPLAILVTLATGCSRRTGGGATVWAFRKGGDLERGDAQSAVVDGDGNVYAAWTYRGTVDLGGGPLPSGCAEGYVPTDLALAKFSPSGAHLWSKHFVCITAAALAVDPTGALVIAGTVGQTTDFGGGPLGSNSGVNDVFVAKLDPTGKHLWSERFAAGNHAAAKTVSVDASGAIAVGGSFYDSLAFGDGARVTGAFSNTGNLFVVKLDPNGKHLFSRAFETNAWQRASVAFTPTGDLVFAGSVSESVDFGTGKLAGGAFIATFDRSGKTIRANTYGRSEGTLAGALSVSSDGDVVVAGSSDAIVDFGTGPLCSEGRLRAEQAWVARFASNGAPRFARCFQGHEMVVLHAHSIAWGVASSPSRVVLVGKLMGGSVDFGGGSLSGDGAGFLLMLDSAGKHRFSQRIDEKGDLDDNVNAVALDRAGSPIYVGGASHMRGDKFFHALFAAKLTP